MLKNTLDLANGVVNRQREALAKTITLIESTRKDHREQAEYLLDYLVHQNHNKKSFQHNNTLRLGIAGPPGSGKSTFIETLGMKFIDQSNRVAVVPVDPSSHISGGSILGDKTRMDNLTKSMDAYVRASPTKGVLGGIAEHTSDVITACEAGSYNIVIVESVGLGQSEVEIDNAVDMLLVIVPPGGGDSLQATKKGIMEAADLVVVNKADGHLMDAAKHTKADYGGAIQFIRQKNYYWNTKVLLMSARTGYGVDEVSKEIGSFHSIMSLNGELKKKRLLQSRYWMWGQVRKQLINLVEKDENIQAYGSQLLHEISNSKMTPRKAATKIIENYLKQK